MSRTLLRKNAPASKTPTTTKSCGMLDTVCKNTLICMVHRTQRIHWLFDILFNNKASQVDCTHAYLYTWFLIIFEQWWFDNYPILSCFPLSKDDAETLEPRSFHIFSAGTQFAGLRAMRLGQTMGVALSYKLASITGTTLEQHWNNIGTTLGRHGT